MNASVDLIWLLSEPVAVQRRLVKAIGEHAGIPIEFRHVEEILDFAAVNGASGKELSLPLGWKLVRKPQELVFTTPDLREASPPEHYDHPLSVPGCVVVSEIGSEFEAQFIPQGTRARYNPDYLLNPDFLPGPLRVRNWRAGDRFWPAHTKSPKKIKELLQELHIAQPERRLWPVVASGSEIVWMRGFPCPVKLQSKPGEQALLVTETRQK
jgi:tRNA(Ile)-lysidine synthase